MKDERRMVVMQSGVDFTVLGRKREAAERGMAVGGCIYVNKQQSPGE